MKKNGKFEKCYDLLSCKISRWLIKGYEYKYKLTIEQLKEDFYYDRLL